MWIFLGIEHGMLLFKYALEVLIPDSPEEVGIQLARNEFIVSKVSVHRLTSRRKSCARLYSSTMKP